MLVTVYLSVYAALAIAAGAILWRAGALAHVAARDIVLVAVACIAAGLCLALTTRRVTPPSTSTSSIE